jgi:hypothetical protein
VHSTQVTLSHIKAYLLLGTIKKADQLFQTIEAPELNAQEMFLSALTDDQFEVPLNKANVPADLLD